MSIKDSALRFATSVENELIQIRADQMESNEALTNRINSVANNLKELRAQFTGLEERFTGLEERFTGLENRLDGVDSRLDGMENRLGRVEDTQTQMMQILLDIHRRVGGG